MNKIILFLLTLTIIPAYSQDAVSWRDQYDTCKFYFNQADYSKASALLKELIPSVEKNVEDTAAYYEMKNLLGISLANTSRAEEGIKVLEETVLYYSSHDPDQNYFTALFQLGIINFSTKNYIQAEPAMEKAILFYKEAMGENNKDYLTLLNNLATIETALKNYTKADSVYSHLIELKRAVYGERHPETYSSINALATSSYSSGNFQKAEQLYLQLSNIIKDSLGENCLLYSENCILLATLYKNQQKYKEAITFYEKAAGITKNVSGENSVSYANALTSLGLTYKTIESNSLAESSLLSAVSIYRANTEKEINFTLALSALGSIYRSLGQYSKAEAFLSEALEMVKTMMGYPEEYSTILNNLALLYDETGRFGKAEELYKESLSLTQKSIGEKSPEYATSLNNLASLYKTLGRFEQSEQLYKKALQIRKETLGTDHPQYGESLNNLSSLYQVMGRNKDAESLYLQAIEIAKQTLGEKHPEYASYLNNLAGLYEQMGQFSQAEKLYEQSVSIIRESLGEDHPSYGTTVNNLALLYEKTGKFSQAEVLYKKDLEIVKKSLGVLHPNYAYALSNLAGLYENTGNYKEAERLYREAIEIRKNTFGEKHPEYATVVNNLARVYTATGRLEEAEQLWIVCIQNYLFQINTYFPSMSEREKEEFYHTISPKFEQFNSFCILRKEKNPAILSVMYNNQLATKALLLNSSNKVRERILSSGDENLISSFKQWQHDKELLARYYSQSGNESGFAKINLDSLESKANELEKELSLKSEIFKSSSDQKLFTWQEIQKKLKEGEAAVEIIRFRKYKSDSAGIYSTNVVYYAALVVNPGTSGNPECVLLTNGEELEQQFMKYYRNSIRFKIEDKYAYNQYWKKIKETLGEVKKVYFSPDGVYNQINLYAIQNPETKKYLIDETEIQLVTNTKDLVTHQQSNSPDKRIVLVGDPAFYQNAKVETTTLSPLPGTNAEVKKINEIVLKDNWTGKIYTGSSASEDKLKQVQNPKVLHIATHGFFDQDEDVNEDEDLKNKKYKNPLLKSGLMLAGAGDKSTNTSEDGILTSFEAMNMDLDHTDLVVLSACETGLGEVRNGEGVYGLQRAFRVAGVNSILISLWKVNDETTQKLMVFFYDEWLKTGNSRASFKVAQDKIRKEYPEPYYWGAFVMVGE